MAGDRLRQESQKHVTDGFVGESAAVFVWTAIPYRTEWRYSVIGYKAIAVEAGHICQNLYLACEAIGAGACAILAYGQKAIDNLIGVDGEEEFTICVASVGKVARDKTHQNSLRNETDSRRKCERSLNKTRKKYGKRTCDHV
jgi:nitroreductase